MKDPRTIIVGVQLTEKGTRLTEKENKYFFEVAGDANKVEIKRAVQQLFKVTVTAVNTMRYQGKMRRDRRMKYGRRPGWKRAVVTVKDGDKIDFT